MLPLKSSSHQFNMIDDFNSFDMSMSSNSFLQSPLAYQPENFEETFSKKIQILEDPNYLKEYRNIIQNNSSSLIPSDLLRVIKALNENSVYPENIPSIKNIKKEELITFLETQLNDLKDRVEKNRKELVENGSSEIALVKIAEEENELYEMNVKLERDLEEIKHSLNDFSQSCSTIVGQKIQKSSLLSDFDDLGFESSLGKRFQEFYNYYENFKKVFQRIRKHFKLRNFSTNNFLILKITRFFRDWSCFIKSQIEKQIDYETNSVLLENNNLQSFLGIFLL